MAQDGGGGGGALPPLPELWGGFSPPSPPASYASDLSIPIECRFALHDSMTSNRTLHMFLREDLDLATDIAILEANQQKNVSMNISLCQIASLEVYRGKENTSEINHSGFTLTDRNTIQANTNSNLDHHTNVHYNLIIHVTNM